MITDQMVETASLAVCRAEGLPSVMWPTVADSVRVALEAVLYEAVDQARDAGYGSGYSDGWDACDEHWENAI